MSLEEAQETAKGFLDEGLAGKLSSGMEFLHAVWGVYEEARAAELELRGAVAACGKGCTWCCHTTFSVSRLEFEDMVVGYDALPAKEKYEVSKRVRIMVRDWSDYLRRPMPFKKREIVTMDGILKLLLGFRDRYAIVCPFLSEAEGRCLIYENRPFECRACLAAAKCDPKEEGFLAIPSILDFWPGYVIEEREFQLFGAMAHHPLPHWFMNSKHF